MVDSKKLLIVLVAVFVYVNLYIPLNETNEKEISKLALYKQKLDSEKSFLENNESMLHYIDVSNKSLLNNQKLMYPSDMQDSIIFNTMQAKIKRTALTHNAKVINVIWGEPYTNDEFVHTNMPFTFIVELQPDELSGFLNKIFDNTKAISVKQVFLIRKPKTLLVNMQIHIYKNKNGNIK